MQFTKTSLRSITLKMKLTFFVIVLMGKTTFQKLNNYYNPEILLLINLPKKVKVSQT
ncbi:hypothetical protein D3C87_1257940 [compost metagenome]